MGRSRCSISKVGLAVLVAVLLHAGAPGRAAATVIVGLDPSATVEAVGETITLDIVATDIPDLVLGFGLDLSWDPLILSLVGDPVIGPLWDAFVAPDGDGLAGLAPPAGIAGTDIVLASLTFELIGIGTTPLVLGATAGDPLEGFPLKGGGFAETQFVDGEVTVVVPEPALGLLLGLGLLPLGRPRCLRPQSGGEPHADVPGCLRPKEGRG